MSGTSLDGIDAGLVEFSDDKCRVIAFHYHPFPDSLKQEINKLSQPDQPVLLNDYGSMDTRLGYLFADAVNNVLKKAGLTANSISAVGSHGLTIYHAPHIRYPFSLQIGDPNIIAEKTGITTIADFRRRDIAAHGQGAPLVPAFHQYFFGRHEKNICIVNIGGIANITAINKELVLGFDTGPGNTLMDYWTRKNLNKNYDKNGEWARNGSVQQNLLLHLKNDPYFHKLPAKSTGKEYFSGPWLENKISRHPALSAQNIQTTLCQLTADTITDEIKKHAADTQLTLICGGGCHNRYLLELIAQNLQHPVLTTKDYNINPDHVEAVAFAWLARQTMHKQPGNLYKATGASAPVILGGIYQQLR